ncbi:MAG: hypothetical protein ACOCP4_05060 [Candidatus Woesearchaeota archaeon]
MKKKFIDERDEKLLKIQTIPLEYVGIDRINSRTSKFSLKSRQGIHSFSDKNSNIRYAYLLFKIKAVNSINPVIIKIAYPFKNIQKRIDKNSINKEKSRLEHKYEEKFPVKDNNLKMRIDSVKESTHLDRYQDIVFDNIFKFIKGYYYEMVLDIDYFAGDYNKGFIFFYNKTLDIKSYNSIKEIYGDVLGKKGEIIKPPFRIMDKIKGYKIPFYQVVKKDKSQQNMTLLMDTFNNKINIGVKSNDLINNFDIFKKEGIKSKREISLQKSDKLLPINRYTKKINLYYKKTVNRQNKYRAKSKIQYYLSMMFE